ncbi:MAG TPA: hypothetical protein PK014_06155 [Thermoanaerobaculia bacterium]|nr:hypothetical protein [Thermoanaerobaculia bacterium]HUM29336.1 hypothetical protein [Thermoanaerobaculia bacterium]HXK67582.1 hypothetical protein [Thermoanaerobaculia bacterium]
MQGLPTEGTFGVVDPITLLSHLWKTNFSGAVKIEEGEIHRIIYVDEGAVISLASNHPDEKIDDILISEGKITRDHIRQALEESGSFASLPEQLLGMGFLTRMEMQDAFIQQLQILFSHIISRPGAIYSLVEGYKPARTLTFTYPIPRVIMDFFSRTDNRDLVIDILGNPEVGLTFEHSKINVYKSLEMGSDADELVALMDGRRTMAEMAAQSKWKEFDVYRLYALFLSLGLAARTRPGEFPSEPSHSGGPQTTAPAADSWKGTPPTDDDEEEGPWEPPPVSLPVSKTEDLSLDVGSIDVPPPVSKPSPPIASANTKQVIKPEPELIQRSTTRRKKNKQRLVLYPLAGIVVVVIVAVLFVLFVDHKNKPKQEQPKPVIEEPKQPPTVPVPEDTGGEVKTEPEASAGSPEKAPVSTPKPAKPSTPPAEIKATPAGTVHDRARAHLARVRGMADARFTIQLMIACVEDSIREAEATDPENSHVWYVPYDFKGRDCFKVFWGTYNSQSQAESSRNTVPAIFRRGSTYPPVVPVSQALSNVSD